MIDETTGQKAIEMQHRMVNAVQMRKEGMSQQAIAEANNCSPSTVKRDLTAAMEIVHDDLKGRVAQLRSEEVDRLEGFIEVLTNEALQGNLGNMDRIIKMIQEKAKIMGLYAPNKIFLSADGAISFAKKIVRIALPYIDPVDHAAFAQDVKDVLEREQ